VRIPPFLFLGFLSISAASTADAQETPPPPGPAQEIPSLPPAQAAPSPAPAQAFPPLPAPRAQAAPLPAQRISAAPRVATHDSEAPPDDSTESAVPPGGKLSMWRVEVGYRGSFVPSTGYDPFSTNDSLPQFSLAASRTLVTARPLSLAAGLGWDIGSSSATDRGDRASIAVQRLTVPIEARVHFGARGYLFVRGAPGVVAQHTEVDDPSAPAALSKTQWLFATDVSGGYAFPLWPRTRVPDVARIWLQADGGYGWVASERLNLGPTLASTDARIVSGVDLGTVSLSGPFFRVAAAASF
jgi:hypothetical protein